MLENKINWFRVLIKTFWGVIFTVAGILTMPSAFIPLGWAVTPLRVLMGGIIVGILAELGSRLWDLLLDKADKGFRIYSRKHHSFRTALMIVTNGIIYTTLMGVLLFSLILHYYGVFVITLIFIFSLFTAFLLLLSLLPKIFIGVEGPNDINFLKNIACILRKYGEEVPDLEQLEQDRDVIFLPLGGNNLERWPSRMEVFNRPQIFIIDRDVPPPAPPKHHAFVEDFNKRHRCKAILTGKGEMENYLHPTAIKAVRPEVDITFGDFDDVPTLVAQAIHLNSESTKKWDELEKEKKDEKIKRAKQWLNTDAVAQMTPLLLDERDPTGEVKGWFREITRLLND